MQFVVIGDDIYPLETDADYIEAYEALEAYDLASTPVFVGDPDTDSYPNGMILLRRA